MSTLQASPIFFSSIWVSVTAFLCVLNHCTFLDRLKSSSSGPYIFVETIYIHRNVHKNTICKCNSTFFTIYQMRWHNIPEDLDQCAHCCENLKPCNKWDNYKNWTLECISFISHFSIIFHSPMMSHMKSKMTAKLQGVFMKRAWGKLYCCIHSL